MTVFAMPSIIMSFTGSRIPAELRDAIGLYQFTIGNIGYDPASSTYSNNSVCSVGGQPAVSLFGVPFNGTGAYNGTCVRFLGQTLTGPEVSGVLSVCEVLQILSFFCYVWYLHWIVTSTREKREVSTTAISDYTIIVKNLPKDCTKEQVVAHFNCLYPLDKPDWLGRPGLAGVRPVESAENSHEEMLIGSWIADCVLHKAIGPFLKVFRKQQNLMLQFYRSRAQMKAYADDTPHAGGQNARRYAWAETKMLALGVRLDNLTEVSFTFSSQFLSFKNGINLLLSVLLNRLIIYLRIQSYFILILIAENSTEIS